MLKNLDPLLSPDLLHVLRGMGHGDEIAIVDANYPAVSNAQRLVRIDGRAATDVLAAVLSLLPLDEFVDCPAFRMEVVDDPDGVPEICNEFQNIIDRLEVKDVTLGKIERHAFYERVKDAFAVVATGEVRHYGNVILKKGIIWPD